MHQENKLIRKERYDKACCVGDWDMRKSYRGDLIFSFRIIGNLMGEVGT